MGALCIVECNPLSDHAPGLKPILGLCELDGLSYPFKGLGYTLAIGPVVWDHFNPPARTGKRLERKGIEFISDLVRSEDWKFCSVRASAFQRLHCSMINCPD